MNRESPYSHYGESLARIDQLAGPGIRPPVARHTGRKNAAIFLLLIGGFVFLIGWFAGVSLLWSSSHWTLRDKLIGTLVVPGGLATGLYLFVFRGGGHGFESTFSYPALAALEIGPVASAIYLGRRLKRRAPAA